jgi:MYXO-CTERM domain-containing protein
MKGSPGAQNEYCSDDPGNDTDGDGYTEVAGDCNDDDPSINPGEIDGVSAPNGVANDDANCDGIRDDGIYDNDGDGYTEVDGDCNDASGAVFPGADEGTVADGVDNDCNGCVDDIDHDGDNYGTNGELGCSFDCDDNDSSINPGVSDIPYDGIDQDCNNEDMCDVDADGYDAVECGCAQCTDCDDGNAAVHPGAIEEADGIDNDCNGIIDTPDQDGDHFTVDQGDCLDLAPEDDPNNISASVNPDATEVCGDLLDNDCDGFYDNLPECNNPAAFATVRGGGICGVAGGDSGGPLATALAMVMGLVAASRRRSGDKA